VVLTVVIHLYYLLLPIVYAIHLNRKFNLFFQVFYVNMCAKQWENGIYFCCIFSSFLGIPKNGYFARIPRIQTRIQTARNSQEMSLDTYPLDT